ncbi:hypothetical protein PH586_14235 [Pseudomonas sp. SA3-5]|uniref:Uncharacterized protein n=1 Tax=Pseudomonas aestuarii TaxID=3018340 RepID=A0ABT4XH52_9PSED|nr:hypothetical protein [Pseudomonas aestuarii]MDA7087544.1 hypothetical protein [Pseudomonas aestuarii]
MAVMRILKDVARKFETAIMVVTDDGQDIPTFTGIFRIRDRVPHEKASEGRDAE